MIKKRPWIAYFKILLIWLTYFHLCPLLVSHRAKKVILIHHLVFLAYAQFRYLSSLQTLQTICLLQIKRPKFYHLKTHFNIRTGFFLLFFLWISFYTCSPILTLLFWCQHFRIFAKIFLNLIRLNKRNDNRILLKMSKQLLLYKFIIKFCYMIYLSPHPSFPLLAIIPFLWVLSFYNLIL